MQPWQRYLTSSQLEDKWSMMRRHCTTHLLRAVLVSHIDQPFIGPYHVMKHMERAPAGVQADVSPCQAGTHKCAPLMQS